MEHECVTVADVIGSGLFSASEESYFSHDGCEHCANGLGATVYDVKGYPSLQAAHNGDLYEFQVCGDCLNSLYYGE